MISATVDWDTTNGEEVIAISVIDSDRRARLLYERLKFVLTGGAPSLVKRPDGIYADETQTIRSLRKRWQSPLVNKEGHGNARNSR